MIYYFLPDSGLFGGVKVACQFVGHLNRLGFQAISCFPDGKAPQWFKCNFPVIEEKIALSQITAHDHMIITWPPDHSRLMNLPAKKICHVQGTDPLMDAVFADKDYDLLTCWSQADEYIRKHHGRNTLNVGISVSDIFFQRAGPKYHNLVTYMPRRGHKIASTCISRNPHLDFQAIDEMGEQDVAGLMHASGVYLATAGGEQFGLPALEAMAAGNVVISVPVKGGMEYMQDGYNCFVTRPEDMADKLHWITQPEQAELREIIRVRAIATAFHYHPDIHFRNIQTNGFNGLNEILS